MFLHILYRLSPRKCKLLAVQKKLKEISIGICRFGMKATPLKPRFLGLFHCLTSLYFLVKAGLGIDQSIFTKPLVQLLYILDGANCPVKRAISLR
jgi:hypothetical protein